MRDFIHWVTHAFGVTNPTYKHWIPGLRRDDKSASLRAQRSNLVNNRIDSWIAASPSAPRNDASNKYAKKQSNNAQRSKSAFGG